MGKRRFERGKEQSVTARVAEASSPTESQTTRRRRGRPRKNLENPEDFIKEESHDYEEYEKDEEEVEIIQQKNKVSSSGVEEEGQKWKLE